VPGGGYYISPGYYYNYGYSPYSYWGSGYGLGLGYFYDPFFPAYGYGGFGYGLGYGYGGYGYDQGYGGGGYQRERGTQDLVSAHRASQRGPHTDRDRLQAGQCGVGQ